MLDNKIEQMLMKCIGDGNINFSIIDAESLEVIFTTKSMLELFGVPECIRNDQYFEYWLNNIVIPECRKEQEKILKTKIFPRTRYYFAKIKNEYKHVNVITSDVITCEDRLIKVSFVDIRDI